MPHTCSVATARIITRQATYLWRGYNNAGQPPSLSLRKLNSVQPLEWVEQFAPAAANAVILLSAIEPELAATFEFAVTEHLGRWLRLNQDATEPRFKTALVERATTAFELDCGFLWKEGVSGPKTQALLDLATTALMELKNGYAPREIAAASGQGLETLLRDLFEHQRLLRFEAIESAPYQAQEAEAPCG